MADCNKCICFSDDYDRLRREWDDVEILGEKPREKRFCPMYDGPIPEKILAGGECPYFFTKDG